MPIVLRLRNFSLFRFSGSVEMLGISGYLGFAHLPVGGISVLMRATHGGGASSWETLASTKNGQFA